MTEPTTPAERVRAYLDKHAQRPRLADRIHCLDSSDGTEHVPLDVSDLRELLDDLWRCAAARELAIQVMNEATETMSALRTDYETVLHRARKAETELEAERRKVDLLAREAQLDPVLRRELAEARAALAALRPSHETPAADEDHQGGNCADIVVSLVGRAMRAEAQRDAAKAHAEQAERRLAALTGRRDYSHLLDKQVIARYGASGGVRAIGEVRAVQHHPTLVIETPTGETVHWAAPLCQEALGAAPSIAGPSASTDAPVHCTAAQPCEQAGPGFCVCPSVAEPARDCGVAAHRQAVEPIESLVERSSLGTPEARAARESVPEGAARAIADRIRDAEPDDGKPTLQWALQRIADLSDQINRMARRPWPEPSDEQVEAAGVALARWNVHGRERNPRFVMHDTPGDNGYEDIARVVLSHRLAAGTEGDRHG